MTNIILFVTFIASLALFIAMLLIVFAIVVSIAIRAFRENT